MMITASKLQPKRLCYNDKYAIMRNKQYNFLNVMHIVLSSKGNLSVGI